MVHHHHHLQLPNPNPTLPTHHQKSHSNHTRPEPMRDGLPYSHALIFSYSLPLLYLPTPLISSLPRPQIPPVSLPPNPTHPIILSPKFTPSSPPPPPSQKSSSSIPHPPRPRKNLPSHSQKIKLKKSH